MDQEENTNENPSASINDKTEGVRLQPEANKSTSAIKSIYYFVLCCVSIAVVLFSLSVSLKFRYSVLKNEPTNLIIDNWKGHLLLVKAHDMFYTD